MLMGRVYKRLGQQDKAVGCLNTALEMDTKNAAQIQELMDALHLPDAEENAEEDAAEEEEGDEENGNDNNVSGQGQEFEEEEGNDVHTSLTSAAYFAGDIDMDDEDLMAVAGEDDAGMSIGDLSASIDYEGGTDDGDLNI